MKLSIFYFVILLVILSCAKDKVPGPAVDEIQTYIAPCDLPETFFQLDSVKTYGDQWHPEARYRIKFTDTSANGDEYHPMEFYFNHYPNSGMYTLVYQIDTNNQYYPNQIAYIRQEGAYGRRCYGQENANIYVQHDSNELVISWCTLSDTFTYFDNNTLFYVGNKPTKFKVRKTY